MCYGGATVADLRLTDDGRQRLEDIIAARDLNLTEAGKEIGVTRFTFGRWLQGGRIKPKNRHALKHKFGLADSDFAADEAEFDDAGLTLAELRQLGAKLDEALAEGRQSRRQMDLLIRALSAAGVEIPRDVVRPGDR